MDVTTTDAQRINLMFRAFSDPTRLRMLRLLQGGELCVCDLVEVLELPQPSVSRHLAYLRKSGLVSARKAGLWSYYALTPPAGDFHRNLLRCLESCFDDVPDMRADAERVAKVRRPNDCYPK